MYSSPSQQFNKTLKEEEKLDEFLETIFRPSSVLVWWRHDDEVFTCSGEPPNWPGAINQLIRVHTFPANPAKWSQSWFPVKLSDS
jgi:hypothetical protein